MKTALFAAFEKIEDQDDGTVKVYGVASSESRDHDGELITSAAVKKALPDYLVFGNIREMHQPIAAGTAIEARVDDDGVTHLGAHIVDPSSVKKVRAGVLKGFSLGGKVLKRNAKDKTIIEGLRLTEISLVDRPANPDALITLAKFDAAGRVVKSRAKAETDDDTVEETDDVEKGMYDVRQLAELIQSLCYLQSSTAYEAASEKDGSTMPSRLKLACQNLVDILRDMVDEETRELLGGMVDVATISKAIDANDLLKAGRKFSGSTVKMLSGVHEAMKTAVDGLDKLGYAGADNPEEQDTPMTDAEKAAADKLIDDKIAKAVGTATEPLTKEVADLKKSVADMTTENADLKAKLAAETTKAETATKLANDLAAEAVSKGYVKPVPKSGDTGTGKAADDIAKGKPTDVAAELKASFGRPLSPIRG